MTAAATLLFTDIEGSTTLFQRHPDRYPRAVARHHEILADAVAAHGGRVFETIGDAAYAALPSVADGVLAALDAQRALQAEDWGQLGAIRVRIAIHLGEADLRDGRFYGAAVQQCERLVPAGHGGQVLLSNDAAEALAAGMPDELFLRDMGTHRLRGLPSEQRLFQLVHRELRPEFPPLRTLGATLERLPPVAGTFVGRRDELAEIARSIRTSRLVTVTGPSGIGKTRIALEIARALLDDFSDGVSFVALESGGPSVAQLIATALGLNAEGGDDALVRYLEPKQLLLVIDRCDRSLTECARLADRMLRGSRHLRILATSREPLGMSGELKVRLGPLSSPQPTDATAGLPPEVLDRYDAARLFLDRAAAGRGAIEGERDAQLVLELLAELDGQPGAIERAARAVADRGLEAALADAREACQIEGDDDLGAAERALFRRLSVLDGTWTLETAEAVGAPLADGTTEVLDALSALVDRSLVITETGPDGTLQYRIPPPLRRYGQRRLAEAGELDEIQRRRDALEPLTGPKR